MPGVGAPAARFVVEAPLGAGASGVVYRAFDHERGEHVALKALRPSERAEIKRLCEALHPLKHPGLVTLHEVVLHEDGHYLSMELVEGQQLLAYVRPHDALSLERLRLALVQLIQALSALHAHHKVHRDVKPANVRVRPDGRVVLLDFGLMCEAHSVATELVGTLAYAAPEQLLGEEVGPSADFYALGAVLFEALTGRLPFVGDREAVLRQKARGTVPTFEGVEVESDLAELALLWLDPDPDTRPTARDALRRLGVSELRASTRPSPEQEPSRGAPFVGREAELEELGALLDPRVVVLHGPEGVGKTALFAAFRARVERTRADVTFIDLQCPLQRREPFAALRPLAQALATFAKEGFACDEPIRALLGQMFTSFAPLGSASNDALHELDRMEARWRAFEVMGQLLCGLASDRHVIISIDYAEFADADTRAGLSRLIGHARRANVAWLILSTSDKPPFRTVVDRTISLLPLSRQRAAELFSRLAETHGEPQASLDDSQLSFGSSPLEIEERARCEDTLGRAKVSALSFDEALLARVDALEPDARTMLELLAIACDPLPRSVLSHAALIHDETRFLRLLAALRSASYVMPSARDAKNHVGIAHRRLASIVRSAISTARLTDLTSRLAYASVGTGPEGSYVLAGLPAAHVPRALAEEALEALSREAERAFSFRLHVDCLERLWSLGRERTPAFSARIGEALACASEPRAAAERLIFAADSAQGAERLELLKRATELALTGGDVALGLSLVERVLREVGQELTPSTGRSLARFLYNRARIRIRGLSYTERSTYDVSRSELARNDALWTVGKHMAMVDVLRGADYQARSLLSALSLGEPVRVARALCLEAFLALPRTFEELAKAHQILDQADAIAAQHGDRYTPVFSAFVRGASSMAVLDSERALPHLRSAERALRDRADAATWERANVHVQLLLALLVSGDYVQLSERAAQFFREAEERGDRYSATHLTLIAHFRSFLMRDEPDAALSAVEHALSGWDVGNFQVQHFLAMTARAEIGLYMGDPDTSDRFELSYPRLLRSGLGRVPIVRNYARFLRGLSALLAARHGLSRTKKLAIAEACARDALKEKLAVGHGQGFHLQAGIAALNDDRAGAISGLRKAIDSYQATKLGTYVLDARHALGRLLGGDEGNALREQALSTVAAYGYRAPLKHLAIGGAPFGPF